MTNRRNVPAGLALAAVALAEAFGIQPCDAAAAQRAIESGKPVILHVDAPWRLDVALQAPARTPCAGPTLGAAFALAAEARSLVAAITTMGIYALGAAGALAALGSEAGASPRGAAGSPQPPAQPGASRLAC